MKLRLLFMSLVFLPLLASAAARPGAKFATRSVTIAEHGMVCTSHPLASQAGLEILRKGGSAVDAAIAANACLGLMEPVSCGVGGDLFAIVWDAKTQRLHGLNASGRAPYLLTAEHFRSNNLSRMPSYGPLPVTVPGCVDGWAELHKKFGKLSLRTILAPAIGYARDGFPLSEVIAGGWPTPRSPQAKYPNFLATFLPDGKPLRAGQIFKNPGLARTLDKVARGGRNAFYKGEIPRMISSYMLRHGGFLTEQDFLDHKSTWVDPVSSNYRGYDVWELPPNGQGIAALQILNILEGYDLKKFGFGSPEHMHLFVEAKKLAYEDRARYYADPAFSQIPVPRLISKGYADERRKLIRPDRAATEYEPGDMILKTSDTIYLTTSDAKGNMVSFIQSNYRGMGSGMTPDGLGFCLQNRGEGFNVSDEKHPNFYAPHKRPFHTIIPAFVTKDGRPWMSFGVMGGDMQPQGHVQILLNLIDFGMGLQEAGDAPRIYHTGSSEPSGGRMENGGTVNLENGFPEASLAALRKLGHTLGRTATGSFGGYQAIRWDATNKVYHGATESRKDGHAVGY